MRGDLRQHMFASYFFWYTRNPLWGLIWCAFALKNLANSPYFRKFHLFQSCKHQAYPLFSSEIGGIRDIFKSKCASNENSNSIHHRLLVYQKNYEANICWRRYPLMKNYMGVPILHDSDRLWRKVKFVVKFFLWMMTCKNLKIITCPY